MRWDPSCKVKCVQSKCAGIPRVWSAVKRLQLVTGSGSEFNWDTTGQEEVGVWGAYYNASSSDPFKGSLQRRAVDSILAFMPSTPNFAYHGSAAATRTHATTMKE